jgi:hypothetical protein
MIRLVREPIDIKEFEAMSPADGTLCLFLGVVRNENAGKPVLHLDYEAYAEVEADPGPFGAPAGAPGDRRNQRRCRGDRAPPWRGLRRLPLSDRRLEGHRAPSGKRSSTPTARCGWKATAPVPPNMPTDGRRQAQQRKGDDRMTRSARALLVSGLLLLPALARAQDANPDAPKRDWGWSLFVRDVFDAERAVGVRRRVFGQGAFFLSGSWNREQRDFGNDIPKAEVTRLGVGYGLRLLLGDGRMKGLVELEGRYSHDQIDSDAPVSGSRNSRGAGGYTGFEYFLGRSLSLSARMGVSWEEWDEPGGGDTRRIAVLRPNIFLSGYW